jgi:glycerol-3-phosphate dehydrogenase
VLPADEDVAYLLGAVNAFFGTAIARDDVAGTYAGVRPLISTGDPKKSVDISRKAELYETSSGMITITGGKLTTWRRMAKMTVDRLVEREARTAPCRTQDVPLGQAVDATQLLRVEGVPEDAYERLARRYGHAAHEVLAVAAQRGELAQPIVAGGPPDLLAETAYAARREQAVTVGDALLRRTRIALLAARAVADPDGATARRVAAAMAPELGWDDRETEAQARAFAAEAGAEGIIPTP